MTCIIGLADQGKVYIGADSIVSNGYTREITERSKVFRVGEFLIGSCGSIRMANVLQYHLSVRPIEEHEDVDRYMVVAFVEGVRDYALGALLALHDLAPEKRIRQALEISAELCALVSAPFHIEVLG